jgi:hypothetical protein
MFTRPFFKFSKRAIQPKTLKIHRHTVLPTIVFVYNFCVNLLLSFSVV